MTMQREGMGVYTRRTALKGVAGGVALAASTAIPAIAGENPDTELLALFDERDRITVAYEEAGQAWDAAHESPPKWARDGWPAIDYRDPIFEPLAMNSIGLAKRPHPKEFRERVHMWVVGRHIFTATEPPISVPPFGTVPTRMRRTPHRK